MGGSKGGKHSKGKGKSKLMKNERSHDLARTSNDEARGQGDSKEKSPDTQITASYKYTDTELEEFLLIKLENLYIKAKDWLLKSGYDMADVDRAILNTGHVLGPKDFQNNILTNCIAFIDQKVVPRGRAFRDMRELYKGMLEAMIDSLLLTERDLKRSDALWLLLVRKWGSLPPISTPSVGLGRDNNKNGNKDGSSGSTSRISNEGTSTPYFSSASEKSQSELLASSSKKVRLLARIKSRPALVSQIRQDIPTLRAVVEREIGTTFIELQGHQYVGCAPIEECNLVNPEILTFLDEECLKRWQDSSPSDRKTKLIVDLMKSIRDLEEKVKVQKEWAEKKVVDSAKRLSKDLLELSVLKLEKMEIQRLKDEKLSSENSCMLMLKETEQSLRNVNCELSNMSESIRMLEASNVRIRADTGALRLSASEYGNQLNQLLKREMKCMKKLATTGKQTSHLRANCDEEKQKVLQLQLDVFQAENEANEAEDRWKQEIQEKEQMLALLAEETRKAGPHKANLRAELLALRRKTELDRNLKKDEVKGLERDLSRLQMFRQFSNLSLEGDTFLYNGVEIKSLESSAPHDCSKHWTCMQCLTNEVSIVFLPCTHQVLCARCYEGSCSTSESRQRCPYCGAEIEQCIKAYPPS